MFDQFVAQVPDLLFKLLPEFGMLLQVLDAFQYTDHVNNRQSLGMNLRAGMVPEVVHDVFRTSHKRTDTPIGLGKRTQVNVDGVVDTQLFPRTGPGFALHAKPVGVVHQQTEFV